MSRRFFFIGLFLYVAVESAWADTSPMVEKHIFSPESTGEQKEEAPAVQGVINGALEKEFLFTGVIISPKGKSVFLTENASNAKGGLKQVLKQGDQIKGMRIQEIGPNFVLLAGKENTTVKMNLYKGAKARPAPVFADAKPEKASGKKPEAAAGTNNQQPISPPEMDKMPEAQPQGAPAAEKESVSPFGGGKNRTPKEPSGEAPVNPFSELLNNASRRGPAPANPFNQLPVNQ